MPLAVSVTLLYVVPLGTPMLLSKLIKPADTARVAPLLIVEGRVNCVPGPFKAYKEDELVEVSTSKAAGLGSVMLSDAVYILTPAVMLVLLEEVSATELKVVAVGACPMLLPKLIEPADTVKLAPVVILEGRVNVEPSALKL